MSFREKEIDAIPDSDIFSMEHYSKMSVDELLGARRKAETELMICNRLKKDKTYTMSNINLLNALIERKLDEEYSGDSRGGIVIG